MQLSGCEKVPEGPGRGRKGRRKGPIVPTKGRGIAGKEDPVVRMNGDSNMLTISGGNDEGDPPVPIPNTEVKPFSADGTWLVTARESRSPPVPMNPLAYSEWIFFAPVPGNSAFRTFGWHMCDGSG